MMASQTLRLSSLSFMFNSVLRVNQQPPAYREGFYGNRGTTSIGPGHRRSTATMPVALEGLRHDGQRRAGLREVRQLPPHQGRGPGQADRCGHGFTSIKGDGTDGDDQWMVDRKALSIPEARRDF